MIVNAMICGLAILTGILVLVFTLARFARGLAAAVKAEPEPDFESFVRGWKSCEEFKANGFALETIQEIIFSSK
jgi:hypothetical protein